MTTWRRWPMRLTVLVLAVLPAWMVLLGTLSAYQLTG
jgi:hypothetical protein